MFGITDIRSIARACGWRLSGSELRVIEGSAHVRAGINLDHPVTVVLRHDKIILRAKVTSTAKVSIFLKDVMDGRDVNLFLLEQHLGTPFVRFEIQGNQIYGVATYEGPWSTTEPLRWMIRDLARECQRLKSLISGSL
jgi:hypothetical protein